MDNSKLKILQVCSARVAIYGAVQSLMTLAKQQRECGHAVEFLTFKGKQFGQEVRDLGYPVHEVKVRGKIDPAAILRMRSVIRVGRFDIVHTHLSTSSVNGTLAARMARVPSVASVHGLSGKLSFIAATHLIAVSNQVKIHLMRQGMAERKISVVFNGMDIPGSLRSRAEARVRWGISGSPVLGTVSRVTELKGISDALRAVAQLVKDFPNLQYLVVGDGDGLAHAQALARELGIGAAVKFVGYQTDVMDCLAAMDLFLFPSHKEAMGIALVEAMAAQLPIVSTNVGGIPEVLLESGGRLVPSVNPLALANECRSLLNNPDLMKAMGKFNWERAVSVFSVESMESGTLAVYRALLTKS